VHATNFALILSITLWPRAGSGVPGQISYKATKPGLVSVLYLSMRYTVLLFIRAPFYVLLVFVAMCSVFWLFWLNAVGAYLPSDWLERLLWRSLIVARGSSPESPGRKVRWFSWFIVLFHRFIMYLCCLLPLRDTFSYFYGAIFVLKVQLNLKQTNYRIVGCLGIASPSWQRILHGLTGIGHFIVHIKLIYV